MRFARIDNILVEAGPGLKGSCPGCTQSVIAKCGTQRIHHWAHRGNKACDSWWERETEWHRSWKKNFPGEWQEIFLPDEHTGEKHIADVRTPYGLVIEFQHSHIDPPKRTSRERFYQRMIWVVDGTRLLRDYPRFVKEKKFFQPINQSAFRIDYPEECFPLQWLGSTVPVIFDFKGISSSDDPDTSNHLYCLFPTLIRRSAILFVLPRKVFIDAVIAGNLYEWAEKSMNDIHQVNKEQIKQVDIQERLQVAMNSRRFFRW